MASKRPALATLAGILFVLVGFVTGLPTLFLGNYQGIIMFIVPFIIGMGLLKRWDIMWYVGIVFAVFGIITGIVSVITTFDIGKLISVILCLAVIGILFIPNIKTYYIDQ